MYGCLLGVVHRWPGNTGTWYKLYGVIRMAWLFRGDARQYVVLDNGHKQKAAFSGLIYWGWLRGVSWLKVRLPSCIFFLPGFDLSRDLSHRVYNFPVGTSWSCEQFIASVILYQRCGLDSLHMLQMKSQQLRGNLCSTGSEISFW